MPFQKGHQHIENWRKAVSKPRPPHVGEAVSRAQKGRQHQRQEGFQPGHAAHPGTEATRFKPGQPPACPPEKHAQKHGMAGTNFYSRWSAMRQRCTNPKAAQYADYGGRALGATGAPSARSPTDGGRARLPRRAAPVGALAAGAGGHRVFHLARELPLGGQGRGHAGGGPGAGPLTVNGRTQCMSDWAKEIGITYSALWKRLRKMTPEEAVGTG